jgi:hypothetical protein
MTKQYLLSAQVVAPPLPDWLINQANQTLLDSSATPQTKIHQWDPAYVERINVRQGKSSRNAFNNSYYLNNECLEWVKQNIDLNIFDIRITTTDPGCEHKGPHKDLTRQYTGIYVLESGGPENQTCFYRDKNLPGLDCPTGHYITDYDRIETICCVKFNPGQWYILNSHILHGVENISQGRKTLQFSINNIDSLPYTNAILTQYATDLAHLGKEL